MQAHICTLPVSPSIPHAPYNNTSCVMSLYVIYDFVYYLLCIRFARELVVVARFVGVPSSQRFYHIFPKLANRNRVLFAFPPPLPSENRRCDTAARRVVGAGFERCVCVCVTPAESNEIGFGGFLSARCVRVSMLRSRWLPSSSSSSLSRERRRRRRTIFFDTANLCFSFVL